MKSIKISGVLLYLFGFVLVLLLYVNYVFLPLNNSVSVLNAAHVTDAAQIQAYDRQLNKISDLKQTIADAKVKLGKAESNTEVTGKTVAEDVAQAVKTAGVTLQSINVSPETTDKTKTASNGKPLRSVTVDLMISCNNPQLSQLLDYFENQSKGVYYINTVNMTRSSDKLTGNLTMTLYYF